MIQKKRLVSVISFLVTAFAIFVLYEIGVTGFGKPNDTKLPASNVLSTQFERQKSSTVSSGATLHASPIPKVNKYTRSTLPNSLQYSNARSIKYKKPQSAFDANRALAYIKYISTIVGKRFAGTDNEHACAAYIKKEIDKLGYKAVLQEFKLPNNKLSYNVIAALPAGSGIASSKKQIVILGAHYDSKVGPGANDNGSGVGVLFELARLATLQKNRSVEFRFVFFGSEERVGSKADNHHFGSRYYVAQTSATEKKATLSMICVDMVASGNIFTVRSLKKQPGLLSKNILNEAKALRIPAIYKQAGNESDFEAFERAGIDSTWIEWRIDNNWHTLRDTYDRLNKKDLAQTGDLLSKHLFTAQ